MDEVRDAIREKVPVPPEKDFELSAKQAEKVIMKKRNWIYFMWTQVWPITELQRLDRESRKIMVENGGN